MKLTYIQQSGLPPIGDGGDLYTGWDRFGRVVDQRWIKTSSGADLERVQYGFDRASNRVWRKNVVAATGQDEFYEYDGLNQVLSLQRGTLNSTKTGISGTPSWEEDLTFDPTGNWNNYVNQVNGTTTLNQPRTHNPVNEIATISGSSSLMVQDGAGNMIKTPKVSDWAGANVMIYDAWNRLVSVLDGGTAVGEYGYDGQNRRTVKTTGTTTRQYYYSSQWQVMEERINSTATAERQFVWGLMNVDNLVLRDRGAERLYLLQDVFNSTAVANTSGVIQERYGYNAFGLSRVMTPAFGSRSASSFDWETRYVCYRFDAESNFYQVRNRYLHPTLGRWLVRDPVEYADGLNLYRYVENQSINAADPSGLKWKVERKHGATASAVPEDGDTVSDLANSIGLNVADYQKWLTPDSGTTMPNSASDKLRKCDKFEIPNTVIAFWAGDLGWFGRLWVTWNPSVEYLKSLGFDVEVSKHQKGTTYKLQGLLQNAANGKTLHGLYYWGHGSAPYPAQYLLDRHGEVEVEFATLNLSYKMALGLIFSCDSNSGKSAMSSGTTGSIWHGFTGTLVPWPFRAYSPKHYIHHGEQQTK